MNTTSAVQRDRALVDRMNEIRDKLRKQAYLYESPHDFRAGVEATLNMLLRESTHDLHVDMVLDELDRELDIIDS